MKKDDNKPISVITFDGPAGTGKGTISKLVAQKLNWHYLDSGAMFRILAYAALDSNIDLKDDNALSALAKNIDIKFKEAAILLINNDITDLIRTEAIGDAASKIATLPGVRQALANKQRAFHQSPGLVADGRDMGTAIFPNATLKFFLDATVKERAKRRYLQLKNAGTNVTLALILKDLEQRDTRDTSRSVSPLKPAQDAILIDTTALSIDQVLTKVLERIRGTKIPFKSIA